MKSILVLFFFAILCLQSSLGQTKYDTIFNYLSNSPVQIDGQADEDCWTAAKWIPISQTWIPYGASVSTNDFEGRFKVSWDAAYLYLLVEIHDDSLSDDHPDPLQNWWDDDCVEIFIDENRSMGNHERNNNAFAYHISIFYDAIDLNSIGGGINYKDHINVVMDTIGDDLYLWEMAIKLYDATYNNNEPEASRVFLENEKIMGFSLAYCDNDESTSRENFFGTMTLSAATANNSYIDATIFGVMKLIDPFAIPICKKYKFRDTVSICYGEQYIWRGKNLTTQGVFYDSLFTVDHCDSIFILNLNVNPQYFYSESVSVCEGENYIWHGENYTLEGSYYDSTNSIYGCDSIFELKLNLLQKPDPFILIGENQVDANQIYIYSVPENVDVSYNWSIIGGNIISYPTENTVQVQWGSNGTGQISAVARNVIGCLSDSIYLKVDIGSTSLYFKNSSEISIYPNPISEIIYIEGKVNINTQIYDLLGRCLINTNQNSVDVSAFLKGFYILQVIENETLVHRELIIKSDD